ncbi:hypothetical protein J7E42_06925 [Bacillus sp. ISL-37]|nr:hypothetical protein [Bacillus sp. ISL-37]
MMKSNVIKFLQTGTKTKKFRADHPLAEKLQEEMVNEVWNDFMRFAIKDYYPVYLPFLKELTENMEVKEEKEAALLQNLFWWRLSCDSKLSISKTCIDEYIVAHKQVFKNRPIMESWIKSFDQAITKFYFIVHKFNDHVLIVMDMLEEKLIDVIVVDPLSFPIKVGEVVIGTLMPMGNGLYFPVTDFYHFDYEARKDMGVHFHQYFAQQLQTSPMYEAFIYVLSAMLHIERTVSEASTPEIDSLSGSLNDNDE